MYAFTLILQAESAGLTFQRILQDIPADTGAVFAYLLIGSIAFLTWYGSRKSVIQRYAVPRSEVETELGLETGAGEAARGPAVVEPSVVEATTVQPPSTTRPRRASKRDEKISWVG